MQNSTAGANESITNGGKVKRVAQMPGANNTAVRVVIRKIAKSKDPSHVENLRERSNENDIRVSKIGADVSINNLAKGGGGEGEQSAGSMATPEKFSNQSFAAKFGTAVTSSGGQQPRVL